jgi:hypothetical protein
MYRTLRSTVIEWACQLPDWIFLAAGVAICAAALLVPAYLENRQLLWQQGLQARQYQTMLRQEQDYRNTLRALDLNDPVLLERLAYPYLHLKPAGTTPMLVAGHGAPADRFAPVDVWLRRDMPKVGVDYPAYTPLESPWLRLVTGTMRLPALAVGAFMIFLSLLPVARTRGPRAGTTAAAATPPPLTCDAGPMSLGPESGAASAAEPVVAATVTQNQVPPAETPAVGGEAIGLAATAETSTTPPPLPTSAEPVQLCFDNLDGSARA